MNRVGHLLLGVMLLVPGVLLAEGGRLGRLFFTPEERVAIDQARRLAAFRADNKSQAFAGQELTVNGVTKRQGRTVAVWINGQTPLGEWQFPEWVRATDGGSSNWVEVDLPQEAGTLRVKPGQTADRNRGLIKEAYQMQVVVPPAAPKESAKPVATPQAAPVVSQNPKMSMDDVSNLAMNLREIKKMQEEANRLTSSPR